MTNYKKYILGFAVMALINATAFSGFGVKTVQAQAEEPNLLEVVELLISLNVITLDTAEEARATALSIMNNGWAEYEIE